MFWRFPCRQAMLPYKHYRWSSWQSGMGHIFWTATCYKHPQETSLCKNTITWPRKRSTCFLWCLSPVALYLALLFSIFCLTSSIIVCHCSAMFFTATLAPCPLGNQINILPRCLGIHNGEWSLSRSLMNCTIISKLSLCKS